MVMFDTTELFKRALNLKGSESQIDITIEECCELIQALIKYKRSDENIYEQTVIKDKISEELADVSIMIEQMLVTFDIYTEFEAMRAKKIDRLKTRLAIMTEEKENDRCKRKK